MFQNPQDLLEKIKKIEISKYFFADYLQQNSVILEAGAHIGRNTVKFAKLFTEGIIYAFEPVPNLYKELKENTKIFSNVKTFNMALSDREEEITLYVSSGRSTALSSLYKPLDENLAKHPETIFEKIKVFSTTIDAWAIAHNIQNIDFIWLDLQGAELKALHGGQNILKTSKLLFIEGSLKERYAREPLVHDVANWLEEKNFRAIYRDEPKHNKVNILYLKP